MKGAISTSNASCAIIHRLPSGRNKDDADDVAWNHPSRKASSGNDSIKKRPGLTRAFLEECITETQTQLKDALQQPQDFGECRRLQEKLDSLVQMRTEMPTLQELQEALSKAEQNVTRAVEHKDFSAASSFQEQVEELTQRLAAMEQDETAIEQDATSSLGCFKSRAQLEENITSLTMQIDAAVAQKDFATAATLQAQVVKLEAARREFPTVAELKQSLIDTRKELQNAIAFKQFAVADKLQKTIDEMEHKLGEETTQEYPSVVSVPTPTKSPSGSSVDESKTPFDNERSRSIISVSAPTKSPSDTGKPVYRLRPRKPIVVNPHDSVLSVAQTISKARGDAALIVLQERGFAGVLTPHHILEKVVAKHVDPAGVSVSSVMKTKRAVTLTDSAGDALSNMLDNRHRYLPVMDDKGSLVGILDIGQCLNDAIQKLERAEECSNKAAKDVVEQVATLKAGRGAHVNALQALLGPVLEQAFGNKTSPTLRSLLKGKPSTIVSPETNVREAGIIMARDDKAALVVDSGKLVGIVTVKNIMEKAVAKQVSLDVTTVTGIMTPHPLHVLPDVTALEALQIMQEDRVLSLPVCEDDGTVIGSVDVMDIIYGCGGAEGWRSIFDKSALLADDVSDTASCFGSMNRTKSVVSKTFDERSQVQSSQSVPCAISVSTPTKSSSGGGKPVYRLRPRKPIVVNPHDSVLSVAQTISKARGDAALIVLQERGFAGVLTPHHILEKVVAKHLDPAAVSVSSVMKTKRAVTLTDSAGDALSNMLDNRHRYLPVMDDKGSLVGILDIGQCLNDAIQKLDRAEECSNKAAKDVVEQVATLKAGPGAHVNALQALLGPVLEQAFGNKTSPTLRSLLKGKPSTIVSPETNVREAGIIMARDDNAALVVDSGKLVGIVTVKNIMEKAVAKQVPLDVTTVTSIMTPHPLHVLPDVTALEALQIMQEDRVLSLPVCEDDGTVIGSVDVMDIIYGCGGAEGWRSIFDKSALLADDVSDTASCFGSMNRTKSVVSKTFDERSQVQCSQSVPCAISVSTPTKSSSGGGKPVYRLRPRKPIVVNPHDSVLSVAQTISKARGDAALIVLQERGFAGVLTPHHILEKVVAKHLDPAAVSVSSVMKTKRAVTLTDSAGDALSNMLDNRHRYLPVMDDKGSLVGILDIGQCLNDAIQKLDRAEECSNKSAKDVVEQVATLKAGPGVHVNALQALLGPVLEQAFGNQTSPTLRSLLKGKPSTIVSPETNVREAGIIMARDDKAALVVDSGKLVGIVTVKNIMEKAVAKQVPLDVTTVTGIMTPHPLHVLPDVTALEALQIMQEDRVLSLPVCEDDGTVIGSVDVMDIIYGCGGAEGWRSIFDKSALLADDASVADSALSETTTPRSMMLLTPRATSTHSGKSIMKVPTVITPSRSIPSLIGIPESSSQSSSTDSELQFKVVYPDKSVRRLRCKPSLKTLLAILGNELQLTFVDEEGDSILVTSDECLSEAISFAQSKGDAYVRLWANDVTSKSSWWDKVKPLVERSWQ